MNFNIGGRRIGDGFPCYITFEAGPTHDGLDTALKLVRRAAEAGADAVKFQLFDTLGNPVSNAVATLTVNGVPAVSSGGSNVSNFFRYDPIKKQYIFNLSTKMPTIIIGTNVLTLTLDDGSVYDWTIKIK